MNTDTELDEKLLDHFTSGAPNYKSANQAVQANARTEVKKIMPLIKAYTDKQVQQAVAERDSVWIKTQEVVRKAEISNIINDQEPY